MLNDILVTDIIPHAKMLVGFYLFMDEDAEGELYEAEEKNHYLCNCHRMMIDRWIIKLDRSKQINQI